MLEIRIPVMLDTDLFKQIWILERTTTFRIMNFQRSPSASKIRWICEP
jgi:hypothetical protein